MCFGCGKWSSHNWHSEITSQARHFLWDWTAICTVLLFKTTHCLAAREQNGSKLSNFLRNVRASLSACESESWIWVSTRQETPTCFSAPQDSSPSVWPLEGVRVGGDCCAMPGPLDPLPALKKGFLLQLLTAKVAQSRRAENGLFLSQIQKESKHCAKYVGVLPVLVTPGGVLTSLTHSWCLSPSLLQSSWPYSIFLRKTVGWGSKLKITYTHTHLSVKEI